MPASKPTCNRIPLSAVPRSLWVLSTDPVHDLDVIEVPTTNEFVISPRPSAAAVSDLDTVRFLVTEYSDALAGDPVGAAYLSEIRRELDRHVVRVLGELFAVDPELV